MAGDVEPPADDPQIEELLTRCLMVLETEGLDAVEAVLRQHPGPAERVRRRLRNLGAMGLLSDLPPESIGPYRIIERVGEGGMGTVYLAERHDPLRQRVAVKVIKAGMDTRQVLARISTERQTLALMDHANIARVFDAGATAEGRPFFAMEFVSGEPLTRYCQRRHASVSERVKLFLQVCDGVQHAHQKGIVHRDLKPSNILVAEADHGVIAKIIDFGLARATDRRAGLDSLHTQQGDVLGTPEDMAPEQSRADAVDIDTRADVYSLGVMLYELLTGALPLESGHGPGRERVPPRPSARVGGAAARRLRGDLDWITLRALEWDRERRYGTVQQLAADLRAHLADVPVSARPPSTRYRLGKFVRRNRGRVVAGVLLLVSLVGGLAGTLFFLIEAEGHLERFDVVATAVEVEDALEAEARLHPAWPENAGALSAWRDQHGRRLLAKRARVAEALAELRRAGPPESARDQFLVNAAEDLNSRLADLDGPAGVLSRVEERLEWARRIEELSRVDDAGTWGEALAAVRALLPDVDPAFVRPQIGLVPIGRNPASGLWEFYHLRSAADPTVVPRHTADGTIAVTPATGIVFVLVPGGEARVGAQSQDPDAPHFDEWSERDEAPVNSVRLAPFFVARHELTQGQWKRLGGVNNSHFAGMRQRGYEFDDSYPLENVGWQQAVDVLERHGLALPTEAQWEYAARGGEPTPWPWGAELQCLEGRANIADRDAFEMAPQWGAFEAWRDGHVGPAPVGAFDPNGFGLHDVIGNVWEWCRDVYGAASYSQPARVGDGQRDVESRRDYRVARGGSYEYGARMTRVANRLLMTATTRNYNLGLRPVRAVRTAAR